MIGGADINIDRFIEVRKNKGYAQSDLAEGICTQATLSRFENNGKVPSLKILLKLCNRLDLPLSELFPKVGIKHSELNQQMEEAEFSLILSEYERACEIIDGIDLDNVDDSELSMRYHYIKSFIMIYKKDSPIDTLYELNQILLDIKTQDSEIYRLLAYTGTGMVYAQINELDKAEIYFSRILEKIYDYPAKRIEEVWRVLHIVYQCSWFYSLIDELEISNALANHAISICSDNHVTYYLARAAIQLAKNAIKQMKPIEEILILIYEARAYSKINRNKIALISLEEMEVYVKTKYESERNKINE